MKLSQRWLRTFVSPELDSAGLADALTMAGLEVEALEPLSASFAKVVVGRVSSVELHPNADRLRVCKVDTGSGTVAQVVCGAPNVAEGMRAPFAPVGAKLAGSAINRATLRSVESFGMLCSERELGLSEDSGGLMVLPNDAPVGADLAAFLELDDSIFTLKLTPNRGDCLSILGVAREVAAITGAAVKHPVIDPVAATLDAARPIVLEAPEGCPRYCGRVLNLSAAAARTPWWMRTRLERCGLRCVDPIVDVTNYVMLELGQPLHAFDNNCLSGGIRVRWGTPGEQIKLLNGASVALDRKLLVIADEKGPVALAGIMGGEESGVKPDTRAIFLESAFFSPTAIAGRPRALGLESDAAYRFERGVDFAIAGIAMERATHLMLEICGGGAGAISEAVAQLPQRNPVRVRPQRVCKILGAEISASEMSRVFDRLGIAVNRSDAALEVTPPSHRFDLVIEEDFVEEIARIHGYDRIAAVRPHAEAVMLPMPEEARTTATLASALAAHGYQEVVTYSFVDTALENDLGRPSGRITLRNPISANMATMRTTLASGMLETLRFNLNRKQDRVRIFEIGKCFVHSDGNEEYVRVSEPHGFQQQTLLGGLHYGSVYPEQWGFSERVADFFDIKGDLEFIFHDAKIGFEVFQHRALHPGQTCSIHCGGMSVGWLGALHPRLCQRYELVNVPILFEIELDKLARPELPVVTATSRFPPVRRDISVVVSEALEAGAMLQSLTDAAPREVTEVALFDLYRGDGLPDGKKSVAFRVVMNDTEKTLTEQEIEEIVQRLRQVLASRYQAGFRE